MCGEGGLAFTCILVCMLEQSMCVCMYVCVCACFVCVHVLCVCALWSKTETTAGI